MTTTTTIPICVITTSQPVSSQSQQSTTSGGNGGGGGSILLMNPYNGSFYSSTRFHCDVACKQPLGVHTLSLVGGGGGGQHNTNSNTNRTEVGGGILAVGYGCNATKSTTESYGMLLTIRTGTGSTKTTASSSSSSSSISNSTTPIVHWKCRLPEIEYPSGLHISPCEQYVVGGSSSGTLYLWNIIGGILVRTIPRAHYGPITAIYWNHHKNNGTTLITGGQDGMVHVYTLQDLISTTISSSSSTTTATVVQPIRTWSGHHLKVTKIIGIGSDRIASVSLDCQIIIMELFSNHIISKIQMPHPITTAVTTSASSNGNGSGGVTLYCGCTNGSIYILDLNHYSIHTTLQKNMGMTAVVHSNNNHHQDSSLDGTSSTIQVYQQQRDSSGNHMDQVFGIPPANTNNPSSTTTTTTTDEVIVPYQNELRGHDHPITCIELIATSTASSAPTPMMIISGDECGTIRIWDTISYCCIRVIRPWSTNIVNTSIPPLTTSSSGSTNAMKINPVTSIHMIYVPNEMDTPAATSTTTTSSSTRTSSLSSSSLRTLMTPFQRYEQQQLSSSSSTAVPPPYGNHRVIVPLLPPQRKGGGLQNNNNDEKGMEMNFWDVTDSTLLLQQLIRKRRRVLQQYVQKQQPKRNHYERKDDYDNEEMEKEFCNETKTTTTTTRTTKTIESKAVAAVELEQLQKELLEAKNTIQRWENVNQQLMERLQQQQQQRR